jgi:membrane fusion protein (multidrug efflux system)
MSNVRDVADAPPSTPARRELGAPPLAAARRDRPRIARYAIAVLGALALLAIGYVAWRTYGGDGASPPQAGRPPVAVVVATATARVWQTQVSALGTLVAVQGVQVTSEVPGMVSAIYFQSGESVRAGALLVELDATADRARLASLVAQLEQARADDIRNRRLVERGLISTAEAEQSATTVKTLAAQAQEQRTLINKKRIEAPFAGELGIRLVNLGQFIAAGQPIVPLQSIAPVYVNFALPEALYPAITRGQAVEVSVDAFPERQFAGTVNAISPEVSEATRNFDVQALLPNEARLLRPGMFAQVTVGLSERRDVVTVPATAISYSPQGDAVFVVVEPPSGATPEVPTEPPGMTDNGTQEAAAGHPSSSANLPTVRRTLVQVGERRGPDVAILAGVAAGERVVTAGQIKLYDGAPVSISNAAAGTHTPPAQRQER